MFQPTQDHPSPAPVTNSSQHSLEHNEEVSSIRNAAPAPQELLNKQNPSTLQRISRGSLEVFAKIFGRLRTYQIRFMNDKQLDDEFKVKLYKDIEDQFGTGDIVLCRGTEGFSTRIRWLTMCTWSHVAMIVREPSRKVREAYGIDKKFLEDKVFIFESDTETHKKVDIMVPDSENPGQYKRKESGTHLIPFKLWLDGCFNDYSDAFLTVTRRLQRPEGLKDKEDKEVFPKLEEFMIGLSAVEYEKSYKQMLWGILGWNSKDDMSTVFCSELIAGAFLNMGLFCKCTIPSNYIPREFTSDQRWDEGDFTIERDGFSFDKETRVRVNPAAVTLNQSSLSDSAISGLKFSLLVGTVGFVGAVAYKYIAQ